MISTSILERFHWGKGLGPTRPPSFQARVACCSAARARFHPPDPSGELCGRFNNVATSFVDRTLVNQGWSPRRKKNTRPPTPRPAFNHRPPLLYISTLRVPFLSPKDSIVVRFPFPARSTVANPFLRVSRAVEPSPTRLTTFRCASRMIRAWRHTIHHRYVGGSRFVLERGEGIGLRIPGFR